MVKYMNKVTISVKREKNDMEKQIGNRGEEGDDQADDDDDDVPLRIIEDGRGRKISARSETE